MPGHFTHLYTARRVAEVLAGGDFTDWPALGDGGEAVSHYRPEYCGAVMKKWPKYTSVGAIGPDLFFFSMDWNNEVLGPVSDDIMLALAVYFYYDAAKEHDWEPLLAILEEVSSTFAGILRLVIKLQKIWDGFVDGWNKTIGPFVEVVGEIADDLTGGVLNEFKEVVEQLLNALETVGVQEISTWIDIWDRMNSCIAKGWPEDAFLWSDMLHYRRTSAICQALVRQAEAQRDGTAQGEERFEQLLALAMGWVVHVGTDTIAHSFVNEQCGGPYRTHPVRHHLIENHIDAWNYAQSGPGGTIPEDPWGRTDDYPELSSSALWFEVQLTPDQPNGAERPSPLSDDPDERKVQLDVDGELPTFACNAIVAALIETYADHPHPRIYQGSAYQTAIDAGKFTQIVKSVTGHGLDRPFQELLDGIAPPPPFPVPTGFPLPWEVGTSYRLMITAYKLFFNGGWELPKPRVPDVVIVPPLSDFTNLFQPPDFSGVDGDNPIEDACDVFVALIQWIIKEGSAVLKLLGDLVKMALSPLTYPVRAGLYEIALKLWDVATKTHDVLAHTGLLMPHAEARYPDNGELRWPNEIDLPLITMGGTVDAAFLAALNDAIDPFGALDTDEGVIVGHSGRDPNLPYYPVMRFHANGDLPDAWEFHRPWAYPNTSLLDAEAQSPLDIVLHGFSPATEIQTPTETYLPRACDDEGPAVPYKPMRPGPYAEGTTPDQVFFRTDDGFDASGRYRYEHAQSPWQTDLLNEELIGKAERRASPLGDPVPFSAYLIGQLLNPTEYATQFNLDADRAYAYLTWDWIRGDERDKTALGQPYDLPRVAPYLEQELQDGRQRWKPSEPVQLHYVDPPPPPVIIELQEEPPQRPTRRAAKRATPATPPASAPPRSGRRGSGGAR
jgi:hypothetical protein